MKQTIYGAEITHDLLGLEATATFGDQSQSFTSELDKQTGHSVEPSGLQQAQAWAKEQYKDSLAAAEQRKRDKIKRAVDAAKGKPSPSTSAASEKVAT